MAKTLLYVDDDPDDRDIFCEAVNGMADELTCISVDSCEAAMRVLRINAVDIIFLDYRMPGVDGRQCLNNIKDKCANINVYLYATFMQDFEKEQCKKLGAAQCYNKPGSIIEIQQLVRQVLTL